MKLTVLQPEDLEPLPPGTRYEQALFDVVTRYQLTSNDASILLETQQAGITAIVTEDSDLWRAATNFDVYTWL